MCLREVRGLASVGAIENAGLENDGPNNRADKRVFTPPRSCSPSVPFG